MKKIFSLFAAVLFASSMMAGSVTFSGADFTGGTADTGSAFSVTKNGVTVSSDKAYGTGSELRIYAGGKLNVSAGDVNITNIHAEFTQYTKGTFDDATPNATSWSVDATKQFRISELTVTIDGESGTSEGGEGEGGGSGEGGEADDDVCEVTATGKWSFVESYYDLYDDGSVDINLFTTAGWYFDEDGNLYGTGAGAAVVLDIVPADQSDLVGTYSVADGTLDPTYCYFVEYASDEDEEGTSYELESGTVVIALNEQGTAYTLTYDLTFSDASVGAGTINGLCLVSGGEEGIEDIVLTEKAQKVVVDGAVYVIRDNKMYNVTGTRVR